MNLSSNIQVVWPLAVWVLMERMLWASPSSPSQKTVIHSPRYLMCWLLMVPTWVLLWALAFVCRGSCLAWRGVVVSVCVLSHFSCVWFFATPWAVACQAPLSMGSSRQEHWTGLSCPSPGDLPDPGIKPTSLMSPALAGGLSRGIQPN